MSHEHIRYCDGIGMYTFSRGYDTCLWRTEWCKRYCYWKKYRAMGWSTDESDQEDNSWWQSTSAADFAYELFKRDCKRFRFSMKGEIWNSQDDVTKVMHIALLLPNTEFWIPTRAWHDKDMRAVIQKLSIPNAHVLASVDTSDTEAGIKLLRDEGWSVMYTGDNEESEQLLLGESGLQAKDTVGMFRCPKTWGRRLGYCAVCSDGCFKKTERVEVHLKKHR